MPDTRFPDGIDLGNEAGTASTLKVGGTTIYPVSHVSAALKKVAEGTVVVPLGASGTVFASGLTTVDYVTATPYSTVPTVAGFVNVVSSKSGGTVTLLGVSAAGTASTANGTATWRAVGT